MRDKEARDRDNVKVLGGAQIHRASWASWATTHSHARNLQVRESTVISGILPKSCVNVTVIVVPVASQADVPVVKATDTARIDVSAANFVCRAVAVEEAAIDAEVFPLYVIVNELVPMQVIVCTSSTCPVVIGSSPVGHDRKEQS